MICNKNIIKVICFTLLMTMLLTGCGQGSEYSSPSASEDYVTADYGIAYSSVEKSAGASYDMSESAYNSESNISESGYSDYEYEGTYAEQGDFNIEQLEPKKIDTSMLVYHADIESQTDNYATDISILKDLIEDNDGFIYNETETITNSYEVKYDFEPELHRYDATFKIPCQNYDKVMSSIKSIGLVVYASQDVENVGKQYADIVSELELYREEYAKFSEMIKDAETIEEMFEIEQRMFDLQAQIDRLENNKSDTELDVMYSTISVRYTEVTKYKHDMAWGESVIDTLVSTFGESIINYINVMFNIILLFIMLFPFILFIMVIYIVLRAFKLVPKFSDICKKFKGWVKERKLFKKKDKYPSMYENMRSVVSSEEKKNDEDSPKE